MLEWVFPLFFQGFYAFGSKRKSLVNLEFFLGKTEQPRKGRTGSLLVLELPEFAQARGPCLGLHANKQTRAVLDLPPARTNSSGRSGAGPCAAPAVLVGEVGKCLV